MLMQLSCITLAIFLFLTNFKQKMAWADNRLKGLGRRIIRAPSAAGIVSLLPLQGWAGKNKKPRKLNAEGRQSLRGFDSIFLGYGCPGFIPGVSKTL